MNSSYRAWRRYQGQGYPLSKEGLLKTDERFYEFEKGFEYGVKYAITLLEQEHSKNKKIHSFYYLSSKLLYKLFK